MFVFAISPKVLGDFLSFFFKKSQNLKIYNICKFQLSASRIEKKIKFLSILRAKTAEIRNSIGPVWGLGVLRLVTTELLKKKIPEKWRNKSVIDENMKSVKVGIEQKFLGGNVRNDCPRMFQKEFFKSIE